MSQMLKSIEMMTAAYLEMAKVGKGDFTCDKCVDELIKILNIPGPDELKEMYKKKQQEN